MKTELQKALAAIAPQVSISTLWEHDPDSRFSELTAPGCCFENEDPDDWQAWQSEVRATAISLGEEITGSAYLGGTWERAEDHPATSNPEVSGYEPQMTVEALEELLASVSPEAPALAEQIHTAITFVRAKMAADYELQRIDTPALSLCLPVSA